MKNKSNFCNLSPRAKIEFIWDYYRWHILIALFLIVIGISALYNAISYREPLLNITMIDCNINHNHSDEAFAGFFDAYGYESFDNAILLEDNIRFNIDTENTYASSQRLMCILAAGETDIFFWTGEELDGFIEDGILLDLTQILPDDLLETHNDELIYTTDNNTGKSYPCALTLEGNKWINDNKYYTDCKIGISCRSDHLEVIKEFCVFLLG